jgi:hypothetical protein
MVQIECMIQEKHNKIAITMPRTYALHLELLWIEWASMILLVFKQINTFSEVYAITFYLIGV